MSGYIRMLLWLLIYTALSAVLEVQQSETVCGVQTVRFTKLWATLGVLPLLIFCTLRGDIGDTYNYMHAFSEMPSTFSALPDYIQSLQKDHGFFLLVKNYRLYSESYCISLFLFIASTDYISWMMNGMRQFLAAALVFACCPLLLRKRYGQATLIILLAATLHASALFALPFVFLTRGKAWNRKTLLFLLLTVLVVLFIDRFTNILELLLQETQYKNVVSDWKGFEDNGTNLLRVLVYAVPTLLSLIGLRFIRAENDPLIDLCVNMSIVSTGIYILSAFTSGIFVGRLPIYFSLYNYILLPWELHHMFSKRSVRILTVMMLIFYLFFYFYGLKTFGLL